LVLSYTVSEIQATYWPKNADFPIQVSFNALCLGEPLNP